MSPADAGAVLLEEPDWRERFARYCADFAHDAAFERTLKDWRQFHCTGTEPGKRVPAPAIAGMIALANIGVMAPRWTLRDVPPSSYGYQCDEHMWLSIAGEQWRITAIEDRMLHLEKMTFTGEEPETKQIDLSRADWTKHQEAAVTILDAQK